MKFQFLPHYYKYVGLILYLLYAVLSLQDDFMAGLHGLPHDPYAMSFGLESMLNKKLFDVVGLVGILIYALSKDKVFDEYMIKMRLESMYIVFFGTMLFILLRIIVNNDWKMSAGYLFEAQIIGFLLLNKVRKYFIIDSE